MKKFVSLTMALIMLLTIVSVSLIPVSAASWPSTKNIKTYVISTGNNTTVYQTASSSSKYGTIYAGDLITILGYSGSRLKVSYPTSKGSKTGYIDKSKVTSGTINYATSKWTATSSMTAYRRSSDSSTIGSVSKNDVCYSIATSGSRTQIIYPISGGWKMGWVSTSSIPRNEDTNIISNTSSKTLTNALYGINVKSSKITCGFDGYVNTPGRHEGIDFKYGYGEKIYALADGVITKVVEGYDGSGGLSTIAIYNKKTNKTVVYLHTNPASSLEIGQNITKGQYIAKEANRGASATHTHVEVREGRKTAAAKGVNDYTLDNQNPKAFWNSLGYTVK